MAFDSPASANSLVRPSPFSLIPFSTAMKLRQIHTMRLCVSLTLLAIAGQAAADDLPQIEGIAECMQQFVDAGEIAGAVNLVATQDGIVHFSTSGMMDIDSGREMQP